MAKTAVFRCDASAAIGTGHIVRCSALATALRDRGWHCRFISLPGSRAMVERFGFDHDIDEIETADSPAEVRAWLPGGCDLLVVDSYRLDSRFSASLSDWAARRLDIEDIPTRAIHDADALLDQTLGRHPAEYSGRTSTNTRLMLGPDYALLRPAFAAARAAALARRQAFDLRAPRILISLGGSAPSTAIELALAGAARAATDANVDVVCGSTDFKAPSNGLSVRVHRDIATMDALMRDCDIAIGAGGTSTMERCCLGLPTLLLQLAENQSENARSLASAGAAINLGAVKALDAGQIADSLVKLLNNPSAYRRMWQAAAAICDGLGARRVSGMLDPRLARDGKPVRLRKVAETDAELVYSWQTQPEIRRYAKTPRVPSWDEHTAWFAKRLAHIAGGPFSLIEHGDLAVGVLRLDAIDRIPGLDKPAGPDSYLVSILVAPAAQGKGIAQAALTCARDLLPNGRFYAEVLSTNLASRRLFAATGYNLIRDELFLSSPNT